MIVGPVSGDASVPFHRIARGLHSRLAEPLQIVLWTHDEWRALWTRHAGPAAILPAVDFSRDIVVAVFAGTRPTSGYAIEIDGVHIVGHAVEVTYRERTPPAGALLRPVLTTSFDVIRLPRSEMPVRVRPAPA